MIDQAHPRTDRFTCRECGWPESATDEGCLRTALHHFVHSGHDVERVAFNADGGDSR